MSQSDIPPPTCTTCQKPGDVAYIRGETFFLCENCGTEMKYRPAGELLYSGSNKSKENNGWSESFSVTSSELYSSKAMCVLGVVILLLSICFLGFGKIGIDAAIWSGGSGILLAIIGKRKTIIQNRKVEASLAQYPHWQK